MPPQSLYRMLNQFGVFNRHTERRENMRRGACTHLQQACYYISLILLLITCQCARLPVTLTKWGWSAPSQRQPPLLDFSPAVVLFPLWFRLSYSGRATALFDRNSAVKQIGRATEGGSAARRQAWKEAESRGGSVKDKSRARWRWWWRERERLWWFI